MFLCEAQVHVPASWLKSGKADKLGTSAWTVYPMTWRATGAFDNILTKPMSSYVNKAALGRKWLNSHASMQKPSPLCKDTSTNAHALQTKSWRVEITRTIGCGQQYCLSKSTLSHVSGIIVFQGTHEKSVSSLSCSAASCLSSASILFSLCCKLRKHTTSNLVAV